LSRILIPRKILGKKRLDKYRARRRRMKRNVGMDIDEVGHWGNKIIYHLKIRKMRKHLEDGIEGKKEEYPVN
jgi:hypothetical protein